MTMPQNVGSLRSLILPAVMALSCCGAWADEEDEIVTSCHYSNAEWGAEAIDRCVKENHATRALVLQYPAEHKPIVERCRRNSEWGWSWVKSCVDQDIEAEAALARYPGEKAELVDACRAELAHRGAAKVKACVDGVIEAPSAPQQN
jgi:hypothetical protein